ncbi:hypothetical protein PanWU01x14_318830 [Parasponia andersonii]|uniref:Uncharacterized protein n=1 Tax=Parasponia andersonii TaxID=3476 RepID=A0A2P5AM45_PARAD|nr:hypothetical protein PanWU01x14_318830 [Parasponia andersonii]
MRRTPRADSDDDFEARISTTPRNTFQGIENPVVLLPSQEPESEPETGMRSVALMPMMNDLDLPIALRKGVRSCTQHPISRYVYYDHLSPLARAFISNISDVEIPRNVEEALKILEWKKAVLEEISALEKNGT